MHEVLSIDQWLSVQVTGKIASRRVRSNMYENSRPVPALVALIDELLGDVAGTPVPPSTAPKTPSECKPSPPKKITPIQFERTVYARMKGKERKTKETQLKTQLREEAKLKKEAPGHPVISQIARELKQPPLYRRSIELDKELRTKREKIHQEKLLEEREIEEQIVAKMKEKDKKAKATCRRDPKEFFEYNLAEVQRREKELEVLRAEKAAKEVEGLKFTPNISEKSRVLAQKRGSFQERLVTNAQQKSAKLASLQAKYTPAFRPAIPSASRPSGSPSTEVFTRLYRPRRASESPQRRRSLAETESPPHTNRTTLVITEDSEEES